MGSQGTAAFKKVLAAVEGEKDARKKGGAAGGSASGGKSVAGPAAVVTSTEGQKVRRSSRTARSTQRTASAVSEEDAGGMEKRGSVVTQTSSPFAARTASLVSIGDAEAPDKKSRWSGKKEMEAMRHEVLSVLDKVTYRVGEVESTLKAMEIEMDTVREHGDELREQMDAVLRSQRVNDGVDDSDSSSQQAHSRKRKTAGKGKARQPKQKRARRAQEESQGSESASESGGGNGAAPGTTLPSEPRVFAPMANAPAGPSNVYGQTHRGQRGAQPLRRGWGRGQRGVGGRGRGGFTSGFGARTAPPYGAHLRFEVTIGPLTWGQDPQGMLGMFAHRIETDLGCTLPVAISVLSGMEFGGNRVAHARFGDRSEAQFFAEAWNEWVRDSEEYGDTHAEVMSFMG